MSPDRGTFKCFGCGEGGDAITLRREAREPRLRRRDRVARRPVRRSARVRGDLARAGPPRKRRERLFQLLDRAAAFYERHLWESESGSLRADVPRFPRPGGGGVPRVPPRSRARRGGAGARGREPGLQQDELIGAGLVNRRGNDYFSRRLMFPLADARGRVRGFQAGSSYEDDPLRRSTSTRRRATSSGRVTSSTGSTSHVRRSRSRIAR